MPKGWKMGWGAGRLEPLRDPRSRFFMALACDQRLKILELLKAGEKSSPELIEHLKLNPSVVSRHLTLLREVGLVAARKEGVLLYFRIADPRIQDIMEQAGQIIRDWLEHNQQFFQV